MGARKPSIFMALLAGKVGVLLIHHSQLAKLDELITKSAMT